MEIEKRVFIGKHLELRDELKILMDQGEKSESIDAANQIGRHKVSIEEQRDVVENQEKRNERAPGNYFEKLEEIKNHDKTMPSVIKNGNSSIQENYIAPVTVSYEEQDDSDIPLDKRARGVISDIHTDRIQNMKDMERTTKISRHTTTIEVKVSSRPPKKRSSSLIDEVAAEMEDNIPTTVNESLQKEISYGQEDNADLTITGTKNATIHHFKMKQVCKGSNEEKGNY